MAMVAINEPLIDVSPAANFLWKAREEWQAFGLCNGLGPKANRIFFPERGGNTKQAKKICERCEVREECLEYALRVREPFGIWGGMTERERKRIQRERTTA